MLRRNSPDTPTADVSVPAVLASASQLEPVDTLVPHPRNPRCGDIGKIVESIEANGFYGVIVAQLGTRYVLAGSHRLAAAKDLGIPEVPVVWVDVDDEQAVRILLADNQTSDAASWDDRGLAALLTDLATLTETGLIGTGSDPDDLDRLLTRIGEPLGDTPGFGEPVGAAACPNCGWVPPPN